MSGWLLSAGLLASAPALADEASFRCQGRPLPVETPEPAPPALPAGALEVRASGPALDWLAWSGANDERGDFLALEAERAWFLERAAGVRVRAVADGATLRAFAPALSRALGLNVVVSPEGVDHQIFLAAPDASLADLLFALEAQELSWWFVDGVLSLAPESESYRGCGAPPELHTDALSLTGAAYPSESLATIYCDFAATWRGSAAIVGETILLRDTEEGLARGRALLENLLPEQPPEPSYSELEGPQ